MVDARQIVDALVGAAAKRMTGSVAAGAAGLGGLALIGTLAYTAYQSYDGGKLSLAMGQGGATAQGGEASVSRAPTPFDPAATSDDDALLFARTMVAAVSADGRVDNNERARILQGVSQAGIDPVATRWLEDELASPASIEDIADPVQTREKAVQVYAAARLAINPDTLQEREFLRQLAESLDLDSALTRQIDEGAASSLA